MAWQTYFPEFIAEGLATTLPADFTDVSWRNDTCPSFYSEARRLIVYMDRAKPEDREWKGSARFAVYRTDEGGGIRDDKNPLATDDTAEVLSFIATHSIQMES